MCWQGLVTITERTDRGLERFYVPVNGHAKP